MKIYNGETLTIEDIDIDESGSSFTNCIFDVISNKNISNINFSFALFSGCIWNASAENCNFTGSEGDSIPSGEKTVNCNMNTGSGSWGNRTDFLENYPNTIELTTDATDTHQPYDGIPDIPANGTSTCNIFIKKKDPYGNYMTDPGDNDQIELENTRGSLSAIQTNLVDGEATIVLTSIAETCISEITATGEDLKEGEIQIQFAPTS